jgi:hypothetical protein
MFLSPSRGCDLALFPRRLPLRLSPSSSPPHAPPRSRTPSCSRLGDTMLATRVPRLSATRRRKGCPGILERRRARRRKGPSLEGHQRPAADRARRLMATQRDWGVQRWPRCDAELIWGKSRTESDIPLFYQLAFLTYETAAGFFLHTTVWYHHVL